jgi:uncharacterized protein
LQLSHVDPATIGVWRWHAVVTTLFLVLVAAVVSFREPLLWPFAPLLVAIVGLGMSWLWPSLSFQHLRFGVDETGIAIERGVIWRSRIALPRVRIQHTDVSQGPLQRRYGVGTLKLYTAGSRHTKIELEGLNYDDAIALRDALLAAGGDSGV